MARQKTPPIGELKSSAHIDEYLSIFDLHGIGRHALVLTTAHALPRFQIKLPSMSTANCHAVPWWCLVQEYALVRANILEREKLAVDVVHGNPTRAQTDLDWLPLDKLTDRTDLLKRQYPLTFLKV